MNENASADYKTVRGLSRGLLLLNLLNKFDGGATVGTLAEFSGLHRTTVRRLLETLQDEGYVRRSRSDDSFRLTIKVRQLSEGFRDEHWISALATPLLGELLREVLWPTDITTGRRCDGGARNHPPLQPPLLPPGDGRPPPAAAADRFGINWLAFAPEHERSPIVEMLAARPEAEYQLAREPENWPPSSNAPGKTATAKTFAAGSRRRKSLPLPSPFAASSGLSAA